MADDATIGVLQSTINERTQALASTRAEAMKYRKERNAIKAERDKLIQERDGLVADRDGWKKKAEASPGEQQARIDELQGKLRARDHGDAWRAELGDRLADKVSVEKIWEAVGYKPDTDQVDAAKIKELVGKAQTDAPYYFKPAGQGAGSDPRGSQQGRPPLKTEISPGRGAPDTASGRFVVRKSDTRNPAWMREHGKQLAEAQKAGTVQFVDDLR